MAVCEEACQSEQAPFGLQAFRGHLYTQKAAQANRMGESGEAADWLNRALELLRPIVAAQPGGDPGLYLAEAERLQATLALDADE